MSESVAATYVTPVKIHEAFPAIRSTALRRWSDKGLISYIETPLRQRLYNLDEISHLLSIKPAARDITEKTEAGVAE